MKTNILKSIFFFAVLFLGACTSEMRMPEVTKSAFPLITLDATSDKLIKNGVLNGKFNLDMYYKDYPEDSRVVIAMNGNYTTPKVYIASVKTFPSAQAVTGAQLKTLFGLSAINPGDYFEVGLDVLMGGVWYPAFNPAGVAYGSGPTNLPGASPIVTFKAPIPIDAFVGKYTCDEPAESYSYSISFSKASTTSVTTANYWNSEWNATFTIDFVNKTYSMPVTVWTSGYSGVESGTVDLVTGKMVGNYTIWRNGAIFEEGVHTYTMK